MMVQFIFQFEIIPTLDFRVMFRDSLLNLASLATWSTKVYLGVLGLDISGQVTTTESHFLGYFEYAEHDGTAYISF